MNPCPYIIGHIMTVMEAAFDPEYGEAWNRRQVSDALAMPSTHALVLDTRGALIEEGSDSGRPSGFVLTRHAADEAGRGSPWPEASGQSRRTGRT